MINLNDKFKKRLLFNLVILILIIPFIFAINVYAQKVEINNISYLKEDDKAVLPVDKSEENNVKKEIETIDNPSIVMNEKSTLIDYDIKTNSVEYIKENQENMIDGITLNIDNEKIYVSSLDVIEEAKNLLYTLYIRDGDVLKNFKETNQIENYIIDGKTITSINIESDINVENGKIPESKAINNGSDLLFVLFHKNKTVEDKKTYEVKDGQTFDDVLKKTKIDEQTFYTNNSKYSTTPIFSKGETIIVNKVDPLIKVAIYFSETKEEKLKYDTIRKEDDEMDYGEEEVVQKGEDGSQKVTYNTKMVNGEVEYKKASKYDLIKNPKNKIINVGTKQSTASGWTAGNLTPAPATGGFIWPSDFRNMTCGIGCYAGHTGADIATNHYGASVYASKGGTVIHSGWDNYGCGYGVSINVGGGIVTNYCHMKQQPNVSAGQSVSQGQVIGYEGATGNTGGTPHIHLEIRLGASSMYSGTPVDPIPYLS